MSRLRCWTTILAVLMLALASRFGSTAAAETCGVAAPCAVPGGTYRVSPPDGLPAGAIVFLHGYRGSGDDMMQDEALRGEFRRAGLLLILPNGPDRSWQVPGEPGAGRDDRGFIAAVADDAARRWNLSRATMWLAGFSVGASAVWDVACHEGGFAAYVALSGQFWDPLPHACDGPPASLLQIHGTTDDVFPLEGRRIGGAQQGDVFASLAILRARDGCRSNPDVMRAEEPFVLRLWTTCASGAELGLALHSGGHELPQGWLALATEWLRSLPQRR